jgi:RNA polymerase sigma-70 factor (ECF subfamily)
LEIWQDRVPKPDKNAAAPETDVDLQSEQVFADLFADTHLKVFRYIYGLHGGPQEAVEDLTAETYLRAWNARHQFTGDRSAVIGWLLTIARNLVIDVQRQATRLRIESELLDDVASEAGTNPEMQVVWTEQQQVLRRIMQNLPVQQREMLVLRYMLGWQVKHIAAYLEMPANTVTVNIKRALEKLRVLWPQT